MKIAYFDCFSGISGDMVLGALVDAGADIARIEAELRKLPVTGWTISAEKVKRNGIGATYVRVETSEQTKHRHLSQILGMIDGAGLTPRVAQRARSIFECLGEAEARIHQTSIEKVHFHEVGAVDAIVDIVGACVGFELLGIEEFACGPINVGAGRVNTAHGVLPVPAPATADMLRQATTYSTGIEKELATPTGAAILAGTTTKYGPLPMMTVAKIGYGAGTAELAEQANVLRIFVGEAAAREASAGWNETVTVIEANVDDMNPQIYAYFSQKALEAGALDVFSTPVQMKKNRPGLLLTILCESAKVDAMSELLFRETTTIGVRAHETRRRILARDSVTVQSKFGGDVRIKVAHLNGDIVNAQPEFEDCQRLAAAAGVPLRQVMADALHAYQHFAKTQKKNS
jgi:uncharacterized protein (TIGR00299 family) protein